MTADEVAKLRQERYNAKVVKLLKPHSDLAVLRVRPDFSLPEHRPGQYSTLGMGNWEPRHPGCQEEHLAPEDEGKLVRRAYSISCSVLDDEGQLLDRTDVDWLEFYIVLVRE